MKKILWNISVVVWVFGAILAASAVALPEGHEVGGGCAVVCASNGVSQTVRMLDYYEAELLLPELKLYLGNGGTEQDRVHYVLQRLSRLDPTRAAEYRKRADAFFDNTLRLKGVALPNTNDYRPVPLSSDCKIEQLANQQTTPFPEKKFFTIQDDLYQSLSLDHRAGLILHEIIYEEARKLGQVNSDNSRYFNALMSSTNLESMDQSTYLDRILKIGFTDAVPKPPIWLADPIHFPDVLVGSLFRAPLSDFTNSSGPLSFLLISGPSWITMSPDGALGGAPRSGDLGQVSLRVRVTDQSGLASDNTVIFNVIRSTGPIWTNVPVRWRDAHVGLEFREALSAYIAGGKSPLSYETLAIPGWMNLDRDTGVMWGVPSDKNLGSVSLRVRVTDQDGYSSDNTVKFNVVMPPGPAPAWVFEELPEGRVGKPYRANLNSMVQVYWAKRTTFTARNIPAWMSIDLDGFLVGTPSASNLGEFSGNFTVTTDLGSNSIELQSRVVP